MFASYLFVPEPRHVLIVGLGAGSMVRFLEHHELATEIFAVDIDPMMLDIARDYFGTRANEQVRLIAADGIEFIRNAPKPFDVIFMDAFLKPSDETDSTGVPLAMKTSAFYQEIQQKLVESGVVVFNINGRTAARTPRLSARVPEAPMCFEPRPQGALWSLPHVDPNHERITI